MNQLRALRWALALALLPLCAAARAPTPEQQLNAAVELLRAGKSQSALNALEALTRREPNFRVAQLMHGELLAALSGEARPGLLSTAGSDPRVAQLAEEARVRMVSEKAVPPAGSLPNAILQLADSYQRAIIVDLPRARLYLLKNNNGKLELLRHHYAAMGKNGARKQVSGDNRTPVGIYQITGWIGDDALPELYGSGALPLDYPNLWDRFMRRTGSGIWLHGVPRDTYSRAPRSSEGCVTMANDDLTVLQPHIRYGHTPVILTDELEWVSAENARVDRDALLARVEAWRAAWASRDTDAYLAFYGTDFSAQGMSRASFATHKKRVNAAKKFIEIDLRDVSLFRYPGTQEPILMVEFTMDYRSDNYKVSSRKQQFWKQAAGGDWLIFREENR